MRTKKLLITGAARMSGELLMERIGNSYEVRMALDHGGAQTMSRQPTRNQDRCDIQEINREV